MLPTHSQPPGGFVSTRLDRAISLMLAIGAFAAVLAATAALDHDPMIKAVSGFWFQSDGFRVLDDMDDFAANHFRGVHPLFTSMAMPIVKAIKFITGLDALHAIAIFNAIVAALWVLLLYRIQRRVGAAPLDACVFTVLAASTSAAMFWFTVPETYPLGSLSILFCIALTVRPASAKRTDALLAIANVFSLGVTVTNVMAGLAATFTQGSVKTAIRICCYSAALFVVAFAVQKIIFPRPPAIFLKSLHTETKYVLNPEQGGPGTSAIGMLAHSIVMPAISIMPPVSAGTYEINTGYFTIQRASLFRSGPIAIAALLLWTAVLVAGGTALIRSKQNSRFRLVLGLTVAGQFLLHLLYGEETFLYALHVAPLLVLIASLSSMTPWRRHALAAAALLVVLLAVNNSARLIETATLSPISKNPQRQKQLVEKLGPGYYVSPADSSDK